MTSTMTTISLIIIFFFYFASYALASPGDSTVQCMSNTTWMDNSKGQNPCVVTAKLINTDNCLKGVGNINPLKEGEIYPNNGKPDDACMCNDPIYSLFSACAACQNFGFEDWGAWTKNCSKVYPTYQGDVPADTEIPGWALLNVESKGNFDITAALNAAQAAASSSSANHETSTSTTSTSSTSTSTSDSSTSTSGGGGGSSSNAGPIAGGVIGGLAFLGLLAGLGFWYRRRRQRPRPRSTAPPMLASYGDNLNTVRSPGPPPYMGELEANPGRPSLSGHGLDPVGKPRPAPLKLYDPSDPSTFPDAAPSTSENTDPRAPMANMTIQYGPGSRAGPAGAGTAKPVPQV